MGLGLVHFHEKSMLKERRQILGLTQQQVADKAKIQLRQYQRFESGEQKLSSAAFKNACKVLEALEMDINKFFHGEYVFGEDVVLSDGKLLYVKTGRPVEEDVTDAPSGEK